jgi:hypothetical protein
MMQKSPRHFNKFQNVKNLEETTILKKTVAKIGVRRKKTKQKTRIFYTTSLKLEGYLVAGVSADFSV